MAQTFTVPGKPVPKARPRAMVRGRHAHIYTPATTKAFERDVGWEAKRAGVRKSQGLLAITLRFHGCSKGDCDNLAKSVLDGLNGIAYGDDGQIVDLHVILDRVGKPARTEVEIRSIGEATA